MLDSNKTNLINGWNRRFDQVYRPLLDNSISGAKRGLQEGIGQRAQGFALMFDLVLGSPQHRYEIIETGTCRNPGNWKDGQSAVLFTDLVDHFAGRVRSVDIDPTAVANARSHVASERFQVYCKDSVTWLQEQTDLESVDLFYLDSWDVKWENDHDSAEHHLREFLAIEPYLKPGAVVAIDDNARFLLSGLRTGKGRRVVEYLENKNKKPLYDQYQIIYQF